MKYLLCGLMLSAAVISQASETISLKLIAEMQGVLEKERWNGFIAEAKRTNWPTPHIPSRWHVENISTGEVKNVEMAGREFGKQLVDQLATLSPKLNGPLASEALYDNAVQLLDLSEWCTATEGYGNLLLAKRSLDLACIPLMRLVGDLTFPAERYEPLLMRLRASWMSAEVRRRILNREADTELFPVSEKQQEELELVWGSGVILGTERKHPGGKERRKSDPLFAHVQERREILANLDFFKDDPSTGVDTPTTANRWNSKIDEAIINATGLRLADEVRSLAEFRKVVKAFPMEYKLKSGKIVVGKDAFDEAWRPTVLRLPEMTIEDWNKRLNLSTGAWTAFNKVERGEILDADSVTERFFRARENAVRKSKEAQPSGSSVSVP